MKHWERFRKARDSRNDRHELICYSCPHAEEVQYLEKLKYPELHQSWDNYENGCLKQKAKRPDSESESCKHCYADWVDEAKSRGKICTKCGVWVKKAGMQVIAQYEDGYKTITSICEECSLALINGIASTKRR